MSERSSLRSRLTQGLGRVACAILGQYPRVDVRRFYDDVPSLDQKIPSVVFQTWSHPLLGRTHARYISRFRHMNADYSFRFFTDGEAEAYMREKWGTHSIYEIYRNANVGPLKTDIWRYCILFERGGVYCDINKTVTKPLRDIIRKDDACLLYYGDTVLSLPPGLTRSDDPLLGHAVGNWFLAFEAGHPFLARAIATIVRNYPSCKGRVFDNVKESVLQFTGPTMLTQAVWDELAANPAVQYRSGGIRLGGNVDLNIRLSWMRYLDNPHYKEFHNKAIVG